MELFNFKDRAVLKFKWIWKFEFELKRAGGKLVGPKRFEIAKLGPATHLVRVGLLTRWVPPVSGCFKPESVWANMARWIRS